MNNDDRLVKKYFLLLNFNPQSWIEDIYFWGATVICFILTKSLFLEIDVETRFWDEPQVLSLFLSLQCLRMGVFNFMEPIVCIPGCKAGWIFFFPYFWICVFFCLSSLVWERKKNLLHSLLSRTMFIYPTKCSYNGFYLQFIFFYILQTVLIYFFSILKMFILSQFNP